MEPNPCESSDPSIRDRVACTLPSWEQVGGTDTMRRVVELFVDRGVADPSIDYDRGGRYPQSQETLARTKSAALGFLSGALGGPLPYAGRSLGEIHRPMGINSGELDAFLAHFRQALGECGVAPTVISQLVVAIEGVRPAILGPAR